MRKQCNGCCYCVFEISKDFHTLSRGQGQRLDSRPMPRTWRPRPRTWTNNVLEHLQGRTCPQELQDWQLDILCDQSGYNEQNRMQPPNVQSTQTSTTLNQNRAKRNLFLLSHCIQQLMSNKHNGTSSSTSSYCCCCYCNFLLYHIDYMINAEEMINIREYSTYHSSLSDNNTITNNILIQIWLNSSVHMDRTERALCQDADPCQLNYCSRWPCDLDLFETQNQQALRDCYEVPLCQIANHSAHRCLFQCTHIHTQLYTDTQKSNVLFPIPHLYVVSVNHQSIKTNLHSRKCCKQITQMNDDDTIV